MPAAWRAHLNVPGSLTPWCVVLLLFAAVAVAVFAQRQELAYASAPASLPPGVLPCIAMAIVSLFSTTQSSRATSLVLPVVPLVAGWVVGQAARMATTACTPAVGPAALGAVTTGSLFGMFLGGHISLVAKGSGAHRAAAWSAVYFAFAIVNLFRAHRRLAHDVTLADVRTASEVRVGAARIGGSAVFTLDDIHVSFRGNRVLTGATLQTSPGELIALVGGNGAGKSTLLRVAAGLIVPDRGSVIVGADDVTSLLPEERAAAGIAFISGARPVFPDLTVVENLRVAAFRSHLTARTFEHATDAVFEIVPALAARKRSRAGVLSGGEQRLLAVAQMLYRRPAILLADELSLGLDSDARVAVLDLLRVLADQGVSAIVVDHDLPTLLSRATRALLLTGGDIESYDHPEELLTRRADLLPATFLAGANG